MGALLCLVRTLPWLAFVSVLLAGTPALAQLQVTRSSATAPALGTTIRGSTTTTFTISTTGAVSRASGNAIRLSNASVTTPTVTISCGLLNLNSLCALRYVRVTITPSGGSGVAHISRFRIGSLSGASYRSSAPVDASSLVFDLNPLGLFGTATFKLGMDVELNAGAASGSQTFDYLVHVEFVT